MLALSRKKNEAIIINNDIEITVLEVKGDQVKLNEALEAMEGHMASDASDNILLHDVNAYDDYEWLRDGTLYGVLQTRGLEVSCYDGASCHIHHLCRGDATHRH